MIHYITTEGLGVPWVGNELRIVDAAGIPFELHAMRTPRTMHFESPWARRLQARSRAALYPLPPLKFALANLAAPFVFGARWFAALGNAIGSERENPRARAACLAHFFVACMWAMDLRRRPVSHIHAQWAFSCASIGMYGAWLLGKPFSFTGHAVDLTRERVALRDKIRRAQFIIAISRWHKDFYVQEGADPDKVHIAYCGIYTDEMPPRPRDRAAGPFHLLSSGRLIGKKGFSVLIDACALLRDRGRIFRCTIGGSGPLELPLREQVSRLGLENIVTLTGEALAQERISAFMHGGDAYALACMWAPDGDVDGLPQMLMEAMACGLPAVSTRLVGIPDLIEHGKSGLLAESGDARSLADAIESLMADAGLCSRLAQAGRDRIFEKFDITTSLEPLLDLFRKALRAANYPLGEAARSTPELVREKVYNRARATA